MQILINLIIELFALMKVFIELDGSYIYFI